MKKTTKRVSKKDVLENAEQINQALKRDIARRDYVNSVIMDAEISQTEMAWTMGYKAALLHAFVFVCVVIAVCAIVFTPSIIEHAGH